MFADYLSNDNSHMEAIWNTPMQGVRACNFKIKGTDTDFPIFISDNPSPSCYELLFCLSGMALTSPNGYAPFQIKENNIFMTSPDFSGRSLNILSPFMGILICIDKDCVHPGLKKLCSILDNPDDFLSIVRISPQNYRGCFLISYGSWSKTVFSTLKLLSDKDQVRFCLLKALELTYIISTHSTALETDIITETNDSYLTHTVISMHNYMQKHIEEKLTIQYMSDKFHISPTAFKNCFKQLYGISVHKWLQSYRLNIAADLLTSTPMTVLEIAQSIGYDGVSQFNVLFKRQFGLPPGQYRKMSFSGCL